MSKKLFSFMLPMLLSFILGVIYCPSPAEAAQVGSAFTYQGQLLELNKPANGSYDFQFALYDAESGGAQVGSTLSQTLPVNDAYFSTSLDFGVGVFDGHAYWLETAVTPAGAGSYTTLSPRQPLNPAPYALCAVSIIDGAVTAAKIDSSGITEGMVLVANGGANPVWEYADRISGNGTVVGMQVFPGSDNNHPNVVGGTGNTVGEYGVTVSGGYNNKATKRGTAVGGGTRNEATNVFATVPGGYESKATGTASFAVGAYNTASGDYSSAIGSYNTASGSHSTAIGTQNTASGIYSIAAGSGAYAEHDGSFVLHDDTYFASLHSSADNQFSASFAGGYRLYSNGLLNPTEGSGVVLAPGSGTWASACDRALKENFATVSSTDVLRNLVAIPVQTWNYKDQDDSIRHIGPMAQDFYAAFGLGEDDKHINTIDAEGVALVSIQALYQLLQEKDNEIQANQSQLQELQERLTALEKSVGK